MIRTLVLFLAVMASAHAQRWPAKPIHVVVPSPPGGPPDLIIRMLAPKMNLGQPLIIENRAGAGGIVGTAYVSKQPADGYTWLFTTASHVNTPPFNDNVPFDPVKDFTHVTLAAQNFGQALMVRPDAPFTTVQQLIEEAKRHPGKLNYASAGIGTASHIPAELMKAMADVNIVEVPYKGVAEAVTDVLAGRMDMFFVGTQLAAQHAKTGRAHVLALTGSKRWKGLPDVPTMQEAGFKGFNIINWFGVWLPAGAPPEVAKRIHAEVVKALADADVKQQFDQQGLEGVGMPPAQFAQFVEKESAFINELARKIRK
jgi:tripartite-type tricarboxylate transporter receptor subunit TctC